VNPQQDVQSDLADIAAGLSSWSEKLRQRGYQPEQVLAEIRTDIESLQSSGVLPMLMALQGRSMPTNPDSN
jgi:capsid protein